jgi:hypothetical protein
MVQGFPTMVEHHDGKRISFVRAGGESHERSLFKTKAQAERFAKFHAAGNGLKYRIQKVHGGYYVWMQWVSAKKRQEIGKKQRSG